MQRFSQHFTIPAGRVRRVPLSLLVAGGLIALAAGADLANVTAQATPPQLTKIMVLMFENNSQDVAYAGMPTLVSLAAQYGKATNYTGVTHPSEGNYVTILSGQGASTCGLADPLPTECTQPGGTVFGAGIGAGKTAKVYQEDMDPACSATADYGHNPWLFFPAEASLCQQNDVPMGTTTSGNLFADIHNGTLPNASMVVPNDCNNAHSCALSVADAWLSSWLSVIFAGTDWQSGHLAVVVTFDEGETTEDVAFVVASPTVTAGTVFGSAADHCSLSRLYAQVLGVAAMNCATTATDLATPFNFGAAGPAPSPTPTVTPTPNPTPTPTPTPTATPTPTPTPSPTPSPIPTPGSFFPKGLFRFGGTDYSNMTGAGFNAVTDGTDPGTLNTLGANGLEGLAWLGQYVNSSCSWELSDAEVASLVDSIKGNPNLLAYQVGDEPNQLSCPQAPQQFAARTALIHLHDPHGLTYTTSDEFNDPSQTPTTSAFAGSVDILGFDIYPCFQGKTSCDFSMIDRAVPVIQSLHLPRWWAVVQDFQDSNWRWPTPTELTEEFNRWSNSGMTGYLVFAWDYLGADITAQPGNVGALALINATFGGQAPTPTPTPTPTPAPTPTPTPTPSPSPTSTPTPAPTAITYIGRVASGTSSSSPNSAVLRVGGAGVRSGDSIIISLLLSTTSSLTDTVSVTDSAGNTYTVDRDTNDGTDGDRLLIISSLRVRALAPGSTVTVTFPDSAEYHVSADEFAGLGAIDQSAGASGSTSSFDSGLTLTTGQPTELLFGNVGIESGDQPEWAAGWSAMPALSIDADFMDTAYRVVGATGRYASDGSVEDGVWMAGIVTYTGQ